MLDIFNEMYETQSYPPEWKKAYIHFIKKSDGNSVRPISLTSCLCKLFESILKNKLQWWIEFNNILPESQTGFRKGQSTIDNLINLTLNVEKAFSNKKDHLAVFLDVNGAFDNVNVDILLQQLATIGCPFKLIKFIKFLTHERLIFNETNSEQIRLVFKGVPQGGVLSPLLYNIYVSKICTNLLKSVTVLQFADDIALYCKRGTAKSCKTLLERAINTAYSNLYAIGLELSPHKTVFVHFNRRNTKSGEMEILVNKTPIKSSKSARFLGIIFDYRLLFHEQVESIHKKVSRATNIVKFLRGTWWGSNLSTLLILYKSFIRSIIDYVCFVYFPTQISEKQRL